MLEEVILTEWGFYIFVSRLVLSCNRYIHTQRYSN